MEQRTIYLRIGTSDHITLKHFASAIRNFLGILEDMDAAISSVGEGVRWEVIFLQKSSPPIIGVKGIPVSKTNRSAPTRVRREVFGSVRALDSAIRKPNVSDSVLSRMNQLAEQARYTGPMEIYTDREKKKGQSAEIGPGLLEKIEQHIGKSSESSGSIVGQLDTIAVHRSNEIRVWDENYGRAVRCEYKSELEPKIKSLLRSRVIVSGSVCFNTRGQPVSVLAEDIDAYPAEDTLPTIEEMSGLLDGLTGTQTLREYMEELSNE